MGAVAQQSQDTSSSSWVPQDDFLLKTSVEAGASLESLAKGAANFSRTFTVQELQDRWNGLLYDPLVSAEASARMMEIEHSNDDDNKCLSEKRKFDSVRQQYYAMRKRICNEPLDSTGLCCITGFVNDNAVGNSEHPLTSGCILTNSLQNNVSVLDSNFDIVNPVSGNDVNNIGFLGGENISIDQNKEVCRNLLETDGGANIPYIGALFHSHEYSSALPDSPVWNAIEGISSPILPDIGTGGELGFDVRLPDVKLENQLSCDDMINSGSSTDKYLAELSNSLFDFTNVEEILLMGSDGNVMQKSYFDDLSSLLFDSPSHNEMLNIASTKALLPSDSFSNISESTCRVEVIGHRDGQETPSTFNPEYCNGVICCVLNTEDHEIPCNDNVFLLTGPSLSEALPFEMQWKIYERPPHPNSSFSRDSSLGQNVNAVVPNPRIRERNNFEQSLRTDDHSVARKTSNLFEGPAQSSSVNLGGCDSIKVVKAEQSNCPSYISDGFCIDKQASGSDRLVSFSQNNGTGNNQETQNPVTILNEETLQAEVDPTKLTDPHLAVTHSQSNQNEFLTLNEDDVPCYSDVEAMILDMDLSPDDQDFYPRRTVQKYEPEKTKKVIIRLERTAAACMQRNMSSRGAFAVLYGRDSNYYIKKPEALLGRSTEDIIVDIDLGREGQNSKVSRRQAIIAMGEDGSFVLRNLGKHSIFVNDKEVASKQSLSLSPGCLIEVSGTPFIFETNENFIKQYLDEIKNKS